MNEGTGLVGRVKSVICARMEETSFRSGALACAAMLVVAGTAIALAVTLGGYQAPPPPPAGAGAARSVALPSGALSPAAPSPSVRPSAEHGARDAGAGPAADQVPAPGQAFPSPWPSSRGRPSLAGTAEAGWFSAGPPSGWHFPWPSALRRLERLRRGIRLSQAWGRLSG